MKKHRSRFTKPKAGPSRPLATTRLYFAVEAIEPPLPSRFGDVLITGSKNTVPLPGEAASPHDNWPYFFQVEQVSFDAAHTLLSAYVTAIRLGSDVHLKIGPYAIAEQAWPHTIEAVPKISAFLLGPLRLYLNS
jgi:hypothetical protein